MALHARSLVVLVAAALAAGCSLLVAPDASQCQTNDDCAQRGAGFEGTVCLDQVCARAAGAPGCTTNAECLAGGPNQICRKSDGTCQAVLSQDCDRVSDGLDLANDDTILFASLLSVRGTNAAAGAVRRNSIELARGELAQLGGVPGGTAGRPRPIGFVHCDDSRDAVAAANHLVKDLGVPVIIGPAASGTFVTVAQQVAIPSGTMLFSPSATAISITSLDDKGLVWRTSPSDAIQAIALDATINEVESKVKVDRSLDRARLFIANKSDTYGTGLLGAVTSSLLLNGKPLADVSNSGSFTSKQYDPPPADMSAVASQILTLAQGGSAPSMVVLIGTAEVITNILVPVEKAWPVATPAIARPYWILPDAGRKQELLDAIGPSDELRLRVRGTIPGTSNALYQQFTIRYDSVFAVSPFPGIFGMAGAYDATYLLAYAAATVPRGQVTGAALAAAMPRTFTGSTPVDVGQNSIGTAFQVLESGNSIKFNGASGPLAFDPATGEAPSDIDVWCVSRDGTGAPVFASSGRRYDATNRQMSGTFACP